MSMPPLLALMPGSLWSGAVRDRNGIAAPTPGAPKYPRTPGGQGHARLVTFERCVARSVHHDHAYGVVALEDVHGDVALVSAQQDVDTGVAELELPDA